MGIRERSWRLADRIGQRTGFLLGAVLMLGAASSALGTTVSIVGSMTADNSMSLYINGSAVPVGNATNWRVSGQWSEFTSLGAQQVVAVEAQNQGTWSTSNPAAFLGQITPSPGTQFLGPDGSLSDLIVTDSSWLYYVGTPPTQGSLNWYDPGYDDSGWLPAFVIGPNNGQTQPWGSANSGQPVAGIATSANWIWSPNYVGTATDPGDSPVYFRRSYVVVPEPITMLAVLLGVGGLGGYLRRRQTA